MPETCWLFAEFPSHFSATEATEVKGFLKLHEKE